MSELDAQRRAALLSALADVRQGIVTTTDWTQFSADFQQDAQRLQIEAGTAQQQWRNRLPTTGNFPHPF